MKVALYARVSKALEQNPENQLIELRRWATATGHEVVGEFVDEVSSKDTRPQKEKVLRLLRLGEIQGVAFWSLDRWGRTLSELITELEEFGRSGRIMMSMKEGIDLSTSAGRMVTGVLAVMANFERDRIQERTLLGLSRVRAQGKKLGRHRMPCYCSKHSAKSIHIYGPERSVSTIAETPPANPRISSEAEASPNQSDVYQNNFPMESKERFCETHGLWEFETGEECPLCEKPMSIK